MEAGERKKATSMCIGWLLARTTASGVYAGGANPPTLLGRFSYATACEVGPASGAVNERMWADEIDIAGPG